MNQGLPTCLLNVRITKETKHKTMQSSNEMKSKKLLSLKKSGYVIQKMN